MDNLDSVVLKDLKTGFHRDGNNLAFISNEKQSFWLHGKRLDEKIIVIGDYPEITLSDARNINFLICDALKISTHRDYIKKCLRRTTNPKKLRALLFEVSDREKKKYIKASKQYSFLNKCFNPRLDERLQSVDELAGVYFLIDCDGSKNKVVYVGQSQNVGARINTHLCDKDFDKICYISCADKEIRTWVEYCYIFYFKPKYNAHIPQYPPDKFDDFCRQIEGKND